MSWYNDYTEAEVGQAIANALAGGGSLVHQANGNLSSATILGLDTPTVLVAGVSGYAIYPTVLMCRLRFGGTPYNTNPPGRLFVGATFGTSGWGTQFGNVPLSYTADRAAPFDIPSRYDGDPEPLTLLDGQPLSMDTPTPATDGDGTLDYSITYLLLNLSTGAFE